MSFLQNKLNSSNAFQIFMKAKDTPDTCPLPSKSILIVENELILAEVIGRRLKSLGYRLAGITASSREAIEIIEEEVPDLILMDINLGQGNPSGIDTAQTILKRFSIPIIYLTGYDDPAIAKEAINIASYGYLRKPTNSRDLQIAIEIAVAKHEKDLQLESIHREKEQYFSRFTAELEALNKTLSESEKRYRGLFEGIPDSIVVYDENGCILNANEETSRRFEVPMEQLIGRKMGEFIDSDFRAVFNSHITDVLNECGEVFETSYITGSGKAFSVELHEHRIVWGDNPAVLSISRDITNRKRTEAALCESNRYLENLMNHANALILVLDPKFRIVRFNHAFECLTGRTEKEVTGKHLSILFPESESEASLQLIQDTLVRGDNDNVEIPVLTAAGEERVILWATANIVNDEGEIISVIAQGQDITKRKRAEKAIQESEENLRILTNNIQTQVWYLIDDHTYGIVNNARAKFLGFESVDLSFKDIYDVFPNEIARMIQESNAEVFRTGKLIHTEEWLPNVAGDERLLSVLKSPWCRPDGSVEYVVCSAEDITRRKRMEEALKRSERHYRDIIEDQTEFICRFSPDSRLTFINDAYCNYFGLQREDCIGKRHSVVLLAEDVKRMKEHLASLTPENPIGIISHRIVMPDGEVRWNCWSDRASYDENGAVIEFQSVGRDITNQKLIETELKTSHENLERQVQERTAELTTLNDILKKEIAERIVAERKQAIASNEKDLLLREIHHRVKNNLQLVSGLLDMTKMRTQDPEIAVILTDVMLKIQTMAQIHTRLYESKRFDRIDMKRQIQDQITALSTIYSNKNREVTYNIRCSGIFLPVDQAIPCALVLNEILSNSYKHAFRGRTHGTVSVSVRKRKGNLRFIVSDDGIGIPKGFDINLANRLGLKLVRTLIQQQLKGTLKFIGDKGTEVIIEFPMKYQEGENDEDTDR